MIFFCDFTGFFVVAFELIETDIRELFNSFNHSRASERNCKADFLTLICNLIAAANLNRTSIDDFFCNIHHIVVVGVCFIKLDCCELRFLF